MKGLADTTTEPTEHTLQSAANDRSSKTDAQEAYALAMTMRTDLDFEARLHSARNRILKLSVQLWESRKETADALDRLTATPSGEWQDISTAPKDGRQMILLLTPSRFPQVAYSNTWWTAGFSVECKPTHWMRLEPLPALTAQKQEAEHG